MIVLDFFGEGTTSANISYVGGDLVFSNSTASLTPDLSSISYQANDLAIIFAYGDSSSGAFSISGSTGWTEIVDNDSPGSAGRGRSFAFYYKILSGSETNPTVDRTITDQLSVSISVIRGIDTVTPLDTPYVNFANPGEQHSFHADDLITPSPPTITTVTDNAAIFTMLGTSHNEVQNFVAPTGFIIGESIESRNQGNQSHYSQAVAYQLDAGTAGEKSFTAWNNTGTLFIADCSAFTLALRPA